MTGVLASVRSADEAEAALAAGADIIDLKEPRSGALGALPAEVIRTAIARIGGCRPLSATVGDLPMEPRLLARAVGNVGALGVDFVKVGLREDPGLASCLTALAWPRRAARASPSLRRRRAGFRGIIEHAR
jgi:uncharacterized protein (UPF0264 family)